MHEAGSGNGADPDAAQTGTTLPVPIAPRHPDAKRPVPSSSRAPPTAPSLPDDPGMTSEAPDLPPRPPVL